jgi:hypothetical protein
LPREASFRCRNGQALRDTEDEREAPVRNLRQMEKMEIDREVGCGEELLPLQGLGGKAEELRFERGLQLFPGHPKLGCHPVEPTAERILNLLERVSVAWRHLALRR